MERIEAWTFLLVFNQGKEVENPRDWPQWRKFKGKSFMRKTKLPDLLEHFSLNLLTWPKWSNRYRKHISQINLCFCLYCVVLRTISVSEIQTTYWNLITELPINNWSYKSNTILSHLVTTIENLHLLLLIRRRQAFLLIVTPQVYY